ncbi:hypothetical protein E2C01_098106 [Portunus trituberculatus]|uniref:Uncharacterized protein n=1 Tax=Portunus trituberculatus TaxID=210409 RepID=A0A5B7K7I0_PORTR|nr:hypothetical protein [Portunus trituberculatus]
MHQSKYRTQGKWLRWTGLGWTGLGWAKLGWAGLGWAGLGRTFPPSPSTFPPLLTNVPRTTDGNFTIFCRNTSSHSSPPQHHTPSHNTTPTPPHHNTHHQNIPTTTPHPPEHHTHQNTTHHHSKLPHNHTPPQHTTPSRSSHRTPLSLQYHSSTSVITPRPLCPSYQPSRLSPPSSPPSQHNVYPESCY